MAIVKETICDFIIINAYSTFYFIFTGKNIIKFNGNRVHYHPNLQLVLVSRLGNPKLPAVFSSLCTYVNYASSHDTVCSNIKTNVLRQLKPALLDYKQELHYKAFSCMQLLSHIDDVMMKIVSEKAGTKELWTDTSALTQLAERRLKVRDCLQIIGIVAN